jgi:hypothetical protein
VQPPKTISTRRSKRAKKLKDAVSLQSITSQTTKARNLYGKDKADEAWEACREAEWKLEIAELSKDNEPLAWRLLWLEFSYLIVLLALGYLVYRFPEYFLWKNMARSIHIQTAWFGALGGVTIGLFGVYSHVQARDFDPKFQLWYISKPVMGAIFGWFVFLAYYLTLLSVQGPQEAGIKSPTLPFAIAFLAGFSERFTIRIIDRLMTVLTTWQEKTTPVPGEKTQGAQGSET